MEIEVTVQSILPSDEPQGRFRLRVSTEFTVEDLLRQLCREANTPVRQDYCLRSKGHDLLERSATLDQCAIQDGAFLHWTSERVDTKTPCRCNTFWFLALICFIIGTVGIVAICVIRFKDAEPITDYAIVFDAGSSHSAMFVYKWEGSKLNGTAVAVQSGAKCNAMGEGIAKFANEPEAAGKSLEPCLDQAKSAIPDHKHSTTPVYLGATAGMRLLREANATAAEAILTSVRHTFQMSPFKFINPKSWVRIISGSEEGTFSWITSNYATNAFNVKRPGTKGIIARTIVPSIGAMDMGGASTQITFVPENETKMPEGYSQDLLLFGHNYTVYTHSYLCYGVNEVTGRIFAALVQEQQNKTEIQHPCLPKGYSVTMSYQAVFGSPCVSGDAALQYYGSQIAVDESAKQDNYTFVGLSDSGNCSSFLNKSLFNTSSCPYPRCSFNGVYQPHVYGPFYAFSSFFYLSNFLNLTTDSSSYNHSKLLVQMENLCKSDWAQVQEFPATPQEKKFVMFYCLQSHYINLLLYDGYKFTDELWTEINFVQKVSNTEVGWSLGFVLHESQGYPADYPEVTMYTLTFAILMVLFCLFIIVSIGLAAQGKRAKGASETRYRRMSQYGAI